MGSMGALCSMIKKLFLALIDLGLTVLESWAMQVRLSDSNADP